MNPSIGPGAKTFTHPSKVAGEDRTDRVRCSSLRHGNHTPFGKSCRWVMPLLYSAPPIVGVAQWISAAARGAISDLAAAGGCQSERIGKACRPHAIVRSCRCDRVESALDQEDDPKPRLVV